MRFVYIRCDHGRRSVCKVVYAYLPRGGSGIGTARDKSWRREGVPGAEGAEGEMPKASKPEKPKVPSRHTQSVEDVGNG